MKGDKKPNQTLKRLAELMDMGYTVVFNGKQGIIYVDKKMHWHVDDHIITPEGPQAFETVINPEEINQALWDKWWEENKDA